MAELIEAGLAIARGGKAVPMNLTARSVGMDAHVLEEQAQDTTWRHLRADQITYVGTEPEQR